MGQIVSIMRRLRKNGRSNVNPACVPPQPNDRKHTGTFNMIIDDVCIPGSSLGLSENTKTGFGFMAMRTD